MEELDGKFCRREITPPSPLSLNRKRAVRRGTQTCHACCVDVAADGCANEGILRCNWWPVEGAESCRQTCRHLLPALEPNPGLTTVTQLTHHGMVFVPVGYTFGAKLFDMEKVQGGSPYGAGTFAADGSRWPSEMELEHAFHQGQYFAGIAKKLKGSA